MVRASRVTNPLSRALGAGIVIGGMAAALFLATDIVGAGHGYTDAAIPEAAKVASVR